MCGLLGQALARPDRRQISMFAVLETEMDKRGGDSWGFYSYPYREDKKTGFKGTDYDHPLYKRGLGKFICDVPSRNLKKFSMIMGHTRDASVGDITVPNAHPYIIGNVVGAHNGAVRNWKELNKKHGRDFEVDSMHLFAHINENKSLEDIHGYGAASFLYRTHPRRIHLFRWNGGLLSAARLYLKSGERIGVAWASTLEALTDSLFASGFEFELQEIKENKAYFVEPDKDAEDIPDIWMMDGYEYRLGHQYPTVVYNQDTQFQGTEKVFCLTCDVIDGLSFHEKGTHSKAGAEKGLSKGLLSDLNSSHYNNRYKCCIAALRDYTSMNKTKGYLYGFDYEIIKVGDLMRVIVKNSTTEKKDENEHTCDLCYGPGPFRRVGKWKMCHTDYGTFKTQTKARKREILGDLKDGKYIPTTKSRLVEDESADFQMYN